MEDSTILILMLILVTFGGFVTIMKSNFFKPKQKRTVKEAQDFNITTVTESYEQTIDVMKRQIELVTEEAKSVKRRLAKEIGLNYERNDNEGELAPRIHSKNLEEHYEIDISKALPLIDSMKGSIPLIKNMDSSKIPELINNPIVKKFVWDYIKKNKDEMISLGVIVPKGEAQSIQDLKTEEDHISNSEESMMGLKFNGDNKKYMA